VSDDVFDRIDKLCDDLDITCQASAARIKELERLRLEETKEAMEHAKRTLSIMEGAAARIKELERERDEALQLTESCSTLKDMASACIDGAVWKHGAEKAESRIKELEADVERLHERLEDNHVFRLDELGDMKRVDVPPGSIMDGIDCRNETIKLQDESNDRLRACVKELEAERDQWKKAAGSGQLTDLCQEALARDIAIEAATIERCVEAETEVAKSWREDAKDRVAKQPPKYDEANTANAHASGAEEVVEAIRALKPPVEEGK